MALTAGEVRRLALLAGLEFDDESAAAMARQLSEVLAHIDRLDPSDDPLPGADAPSAAAPSPAPLRADVPGVDALDRGPADFAPEWRDGFFTVPRLPSHDPAPGEGS